MPLSPGGAADIAVMEWADNHKKNDGLGIFRNYFVFFFLTLWGLLPFCFKVPNTDLHVLAESVEIVLNN